MRFAEHDSPSGVQQRKNHEMTTENKVVKVKEEQQIFNQSTVRTSMGDGSVLGEL